MYCLLLFNSDINEGTICDVPIYLYINGDMKYFAQMLGREGMSISQCMYCQIMHPSDWNGLQSIPNEALWDIAKCKAMTITGGDQKWEQKEPKDKNSIVSVSIIDFIESKDYIFPQLPITFQDWYS